VPNHAKLEEVTGLTMPVFVANGDSDRLIPTKYSYLVAGLIPNPTIKIYPGAAHGFLFQHHEQFAADVLPFLDAAAPAWVVARSASGLTGCCLCRVVACHDPVAGAGAELCIAPISVQ
jgi:acetyl esterase/lipase